MTNEIFWLYYLEQLVILHSSNLNTYRHNFSFSATLFQLKYLKKVQPQVERSLVIRRSFNRHHALHVGPVTPLELHLALIEALLRIRQLAQVPELEVAPRNVQV